jgi:hypothetical protein
MILEPSVIEECVLAIKPVGVGGVIIPERTIGSGFWIRVRDFERSFYFNTKLESARFFRSKLVSQVGGFDEDIVTFEESTLPQKIERSGLKIDVRISSFIQHDEGIFDFKNWLKKKRYYSRTARTYNQRYNGYARYQLSFSYRVCVFIQNRKWVRLLKHPTLTIGLVTLKSLEFFFSELK